MDRHEALGTLGLLPDDEGNYQALERIAEALHSSQGHDWDGCYDPEKFREDAALVLDFLNQPS